MTNGIYALLFVFMTFVGKYLYKMRQITYDNLLDSKEEDKIKILTYNVQRLPVLFRKDVDIKALMDKYQIVCLQEHFSNFVFPIKNHGYNCIHPPPKSYKIVADSGLTIYSKYPIKFIDFIEYEKSRSLDRMASKGFIVTKILDMIVINTHLQAFGSDIKEHQMKQLFDYVNSKFDENEKIIIIGDFNTDLRECKNEKFNKIVPPEKTHQIVGFVDGAFYRNLNISYDCIEKCDQKTDHCGVGMIMEL